MIQEGYEERGAQEILPRLNLENWDAESGSHLEEECREHMWGGLGITCSILDPLGTWVTLGGEDVQQMRITYWGPGGKSGCEQQTGQIRKEGLC